MSELWLSLCVCIGSCESMFVVDQKDNDHLMSEYKIRIHPKKLLLPAS